MFTWSSLLPTRRALIISHDTLMMMLALVAALYARVGGDAFGRYADALTLGLPLLALLSAFVFLAFGLHRGLWRYVSTAELVVIVKAVTVVVAAFLAAMFALTRLEILPRSVPFIHWFMALVLLGGPRLVYRMSRDRRRDRDMAPAAERICVLLVGAGDETAQFLHALATRPGAPWQVVGILDDKGRRTGQTILGQKVLGTLDEMDEVIARLRANNVVVRKLVLTRPGESGDRIRKLFDRADRLGLSLARLPPVTELREAENHPGQGLTLPSISVEDLLGRPHVSLDSTVLSQMISGQRVLVTGAGGTIGGELVRQIAALSPARLILVDHSEFNLYSIETELRAQAHLPLPASAWRGVLGDVRDGDAMMRLFEQERPDLVFHAAALKHLPIVESFPCQGALTNAVGTHHVAQAAAACGSKAMVLISTDKAVKPSSVMGATKRLAEMLCQARDAQSAPGSTRFLTVRFGNVLGSSGSVVPLFQRQLAQGQPLTVTHPEMRRYFMTVREAVELVLHASAFGSAQESVRGTVFVLDMGEPVRILDLARQMIRLANRQPDDPNAIIFTGTRPGEKLNEELFDPAESPRKVAEGLMAATPPLRPLNEMERLVSQIELAAHTGDDEMVRHLVFEALEGKQAQGAT
ncbi:MAG: polysaccharide biosynthesis protein [Alphaproteobacteria bacterium]|nr:MAG: polysaccharide biosynthesis protein [Alphaproteobacteria bacterium]